MARRKKRGTKKTARLLLLLLLGVGLKVLVGGEGEGAADQENGVQADAEAGRVGGVASGRRRRVRLGLRVAGLRKKASAQIVSQVKFRHRGEWRWARAICWDCDRVAGPSQWGRAPVLCWNRGGEGKGKGKGCSAAKAAESERDGGMLLGEKSVCSDDKRTCLFSLPTSRPSRISRASSLWPTSSKASVESWPPTSSRTSSPPLLSSSRQHKNRNRAVR